MLLANADKLRLLRSRQHRQFLANLKCNVMSDERQVFRCKQFWLYNESQHKVGTDSILLGSWVCKNFRHQPVQHVLDVGTGSGVLALMMAQDLHRTVTSIDAVEVDDVSATVAAENFEASCWGASLRLHHMTFQEFALHTHNKYQLVVSNPPFFPASKSTQPAGLARAIARQGMLLPYKDLIAGTMHILSSDGSFCVVLPADGAAEFVSIARQHGLFLKRRLLVHTTSYKPPRRHVMEFVPHPADLTDEKHVIHSGNGKYSDEHKALTEAFYL